MVVSGEIVFHDHEVRKYFWQHPGERKSYQTIKCPVKINTWNFLSNDGFGRIVCFKNCVICSFLCNNIYRYAALLAAREHFGRSQH